jgi:hypothetical protein
MFLRSPQTAGRRAPCSQSKRPCESAIQVPFAGVDLEETRCRSGCIT